MNYTFAQRVKMFLCRWFGHVVRKNESLELGSCTHYYCKRCSFYIGTTIKRNVP